MKYSGNRIELMANRAYYIYAYKTTYPNPGYYYPYQQERYITITGGDDVDNDVLNSWFENNAQRVNTPNYKARYIEFLLTADAIRLKSKSTSQMQWKNGTGYQDAVNGIDLGTDTSGGTAMSNEIIQGKVAYSQGAELIGTLGNANGVSF
jgi:hypothetical protein